MWKSLQEALLPDTIYAFDSGGNPEVIPYLTHERLVEFHRTHYSPSNAYFFICGDIPTDEHLSFLDEILDGFAKTDVDSGGRKTTAVEKTGTGQLHLSDSREEIRRENLGQRCLAARR